MDEKEIELYKKADEYALQIRMDYGFFDKKIDVFLLCEKLNITLVKYSFMTKDKKDCVEKHNLKDGLTRTVGFCGWVCYFLLYNDSQMIERIRFTICHEIGHLVCDFYIPEEYEEKVMDHFARELLAPKCLLINGNYSNPYEVASEFEMSNSSANNALKSALARKKHKEFKYTEQEVEFLKLFKNK